MLLAKKVATMLLQFPHRKAFAISALVDTRRACFR